MLTLVYAPDIGFMSCSLDQFVPNYFTVISMLEWHLSLNPVSRFSREVYRPTGMEREICSVDVTGYSNPVIRMNYTWSTDQIYVTDISVA